MENARRTRTPKRVQYHPQHVLNRILKIWNPVRGSEFYCQYHGLRPLGVLTHGYYFETPFGVFEQIMSF